MSDVEFGDARANLEAALAARSEGCFLCGWILADLEANGRLSGWNLDWGGAPEFPREGEVRHLWIEGLLQQYLMELREVLEDHS